MPVGYWCAGVVTTARTPEPRSGSRARPSPSRGSGTVEIPVAVYTSSCCGLPGYLDPDLAHAARPQRAADQRDRLGHPRDHHDPLRVRDHAPPPGQQGGQRRAQPGQTARVGVTEPVVRQLGELLPLRRRPGRAREQRQVRRPGHEVGPRAGGARREVPRARAGGPRGRAHPGPRPRPLRRYPSAVSCSYASVTSPRDTPRSAARSRLDGSRVPAASRPERTASRSAACKARRRTAPGAEAAGSSTSQAAEPSSRAVGGKRIGPGHRHGSGP
ncbi:hypothetical protein SGLAM104S_01688 [Streptomyces glaucescens]